MKSQLAVVTGATGGIGGAISEALCAGGYSVCLVGRNIAKLQEMQEQLSKRFDDVQVYTKACDLTQTEDRKALVDYALSVSVPLAVWVNNAGINDFSLFSDQDDERIAALVETNVTAPLLTLRQLLSKVDHQQPLQVINVGSTFGTIGYPGFTAYSATKFAIRGLSEALSRELADSAIRVRYFAPRATQTALNSDAVNRMNAELKVTMDTPETVAAAFMACLKGDAATAYVGFPEKFFARLNSWFPGVVGNALKKQLPVIRRYATQKSS